MVQVAVQEYGKATELVLDWSTGNLYIDTPVDEPDEDGLATALTIAERLGLSVVEPEEMGEFEMLEGDTLRLWLAPTNGDDIEGWV